MAKDIVVIGILGSNMDSGERPERWERWRRAAGSRLRLLNEEEVERLRTAWLAPASGDGDQALEELLGAEKLEEIDLFDRMQLANGVKVCRECRTLSEAGRALFGSSRELKKTANDADRLRKYLARFGLSWDQVKV